MSTNFELTAVHGRIYDCLARASVGTEPVAALLMDECFVPKEGLLWDYKECIGCEPAALAKTILQIVSFHNTCGGYLVYGVKEVVKDIEFIPIELDLNGFNQAQLRDKIQHYTSTYIDFTFSIVDFSIKGKAYSAGLLYVPKRRKDVNPVAFIKNGPEKSPGKPTFKQDDTYFRNLDTCIKATTPTDWQTLFSSRTFHPAYGVDIAASNEEPISLTHNLPDKSLICKTFVGREHVLTKLWEWLADDFEYTRILSGDGGKGKTSIAYEFCRTFAQAPPSGYERVLWLSVKEKQFSGMTNGFYELQDSDFSDSVSFLSCLAENCALDTDEYPELSSRVIKRDLKRSLGYFPSLIVVDDVDSLEEDEQRKVVDACRQLGAVNVRFLITTRKKLAYSSELCIDVPGLPLDEFSTYIDSLIDRYKLRQIPAKDIIRLHEKCDGSPLLSASILRLYKQGLPLSTAISEWSGQAGEDARSAALKREISALTTEAKRVLLAIYYFKSCSYTEIKQATGVEELRLVDCLEELQSLFLVNEPRLIDSEERFSISNTTALIVSKHTNEMAFDYRKLADSVKRMKEGPSSKKSGNRRRVGLAINQSLALLKEGRVAEAIATVDNELRSLKTNPDLLLMKARCLMSVSSPEFDEARKLLRQAIESGQKKELAYELWYKAEAGLASANGMIEVSTKALDLDDSDRKNWYERQAKGYVLRSKVRSGGSEMKDLMEASHALTQTLRHAGKMGKEMRVEELNSLHDVIWRKLEADTSYGWLSSFDMVAELIRRGDVRTAMYQNAARCLVEAKAERKLSGRWKTAYDICAEKFGKLLAGRPEKDKLDRPFDDLICEI